jgi:Right handed beta helix region
MPPPAHRSSRPILFAATALVLFALYGTVADALDFASISQPRSLGPAALTLRSDRTYDFSGSLLRCDPNEGVGIIAEGRGSLSVTNVTIEGCAVGIMAVGASVRIEHVTMRNISGVCMLLGGEGGLAVGNVATGCAYGLVVLSNGNRVVQNQFNDNVADGVMVLGDENLIEGNETLRNGGVGIHVVVTVPMIGDAEFVPLIQDHATRNVIRGNRALQNKVDIEEFGRCTGPGLFNEWIENVFETGRPECVH